MPKINDLNMIQFLYHDSKDEDMKRLALSRISDLF